MEEFHVRKCIVAEFHRRGEKAPREEHIKWVFLKCWINSVYLKSLWCGAF
jgi:hypothetical protein